MTMKLHIPDSVQSEIDAGALLVINHSGGKDSQAMTIALHNAGIPASQVLVVHAELPEVDWDGIPYHIERTLPKGWPVVYCRANKTFFEMVERRHEARPDDPCWPSPQYRQCTSDLKRGPIERTIRHWLKEHPEHSKRVVHCIGKRAEESSARAKEAVWRFDKRQSIAGRVVHHWLPIHNWLKTDVRQCVADAGQKLHPAYDAGMSRLSCCFCIMANKSDLTIAAKLRPNLYRRYVNLEGRTGYTMNMARKPLEDVTGVIPIKLDTVGDLL